MFYDFVIQMLIIQDFDVSADYLTQHIIVMLIAHYIWSIKPKFREKKIKNVILIKKCLFLLLFLFYLYYLQLVPPMEELRGI